MPKLFGLDQKQLVTPELCPKRFDIPKMKLVFQNNGLTFRSSNTECQKLNADAKICNLEIHLIPENPS